MPASPSFSPEPPKSPEQLCAQRSQRIMDAVQLKQPDRIPLMIRLGYLLAEIGGMTRLDMHQDPERAHAALVKAALRFQPDNITGPFGSPNPSRALGDRSTKWPGYGLGPDGSFQYIEQEFMKAEDYDDFIEDPADWCIRVYLPRVFGELEGFELFPPLGFTALGYYGVVPNLNVFNHPKMLKTLQALTQAVQFAAESAANMIAGAQQLAAAGFPRDPMSGPILAAPFDFMSDTLRGMRGIFTDLRRQPEKLLAAEEKASHLMLKHAVAVTAAARADGKMAFANFPLHRGDDNFMSIAQFERFYWPQLRQLLLQLIERGITPTIFYEGVWDKRLKYLTELPKGKTIARFHNTDIFKAKEIIGETACIMGGMPVSLLLGGTALQVREHTKRLCEVCGKDGGFIMTTGTAELEGCRPELVEVWADATREFGVY
jgi:uroporphyrinogen-III decarboxylase